TLLAGKQITIPPELLSPDYPVVVTGADPEDRFRDLREVLGIPYFISYPIRIQGDVYGILLTGRLVEAEPYLLRLSRSDVETVQAIATLLASVLVEQRIQSLEERNRIMVDTAPICCVFWDEVGNPTDCNHEALTLFGLSTKDEFINQFHSLSPERQPDGSPSMQAALELIRKAFVNGEAHFRWMHLAPDGGPMPVEVTLIRVPKGENYIVAGYLLDLRDHEAAKARLEETRDLTERLIKAKNEFIASVSHEIRTPLNAILAMARTASEVDGISESQQTIISLGMQSVMMLTSAIEAILDFSKLDSGQLLLETGEFAIRDLLEGIIGIAKGEAIAKSISLNLSVEESVPSLLIGDSTRLGQVVFNIVMNAVKFTEEGGVRIGVSWADNSILSIVVHDTGIGISKEQMEHIFRPLHAGDSSYTRKYSGLGMGLAVSNSLTSLMGGELSCESEPGRGSIFTIRVPLEMPATHHEDDERVIVSTDLGRLKGLRVLVAEDNNINQMIIEELLSNAGIGVTLVDNGLRAIERLHQESFDIILMDVQMPEMDGLMATTQIRTDPRYADLPILAMTANVGKDHVAESIEAGMNDHLSKPVDTEQLYAALLKWSKR
ncbi:MAG: ATP-binding protein, partial [Symbiobacteriaceae bacterium]|nr:ATP-binding protein [Symbiobacteriaceae bacterium]